MFNKNDKIDIIMPNYNKGKFIYKSIKSVLKQSYTNWNLYIIDDNSKDNSIQVIKKFKGKKKIKIIFLKKNKGPSFCRNLVLKKTKSKYIAFLDSDDYWTKNKLKLQLKFMIKNSYPFTFTDYLPMIQYKGFQKFLKATKIDETFTYQKFILNSSINTSTIILERKFLRNIKFRNLNLMEDYIFECDLMRISKIPFKKSVKVTAIYRIIKDSRSSKRINNVLNLWFINKKYNNLNFFDNLKSLFFIGLNSIKKYGFK